MKKNDYLELELTELDQALKITRGEGKLIIFGARPGMGKSSLAISIGAKIAKKMGPVAYYSLEMRAEDIKSLLILQNEIWKSDIAHLPLFIEDSGGINLATIKTRSKEIKLKSGLELIIIDYLQLLTINESDLAIIKKTSKILTELRSLSNELKLPIILLSQLSRAVESRKDFKPRLSDLLNFDQSILAGETIDSVLLLYRDGHYWPSCNTDIKTTEFIIAKNLNRGRM